MSPLKPPAHVQQLTWGYCLPACAQMALAQLNITVSQPQLAQLLGTRLGVGTPFSRVERLAELNIHVRLLRHVSFDDLLASLTTDTAIIVPITTTSGLPGWGNIRTQHAILVINVDVDWISYHDPALSNGPVSARIAEFLLAWDEMDKQAALLSRT